MVKKYHREDSMDSGFSKMISEDKSAVANLPQHVVQKTYPKPKYFNQFELDDTMRGLDDTRDYDVRKLDRQHSDDKY